MFAAGYRLDLYCDGEGCLAGEFGLLPKASVYLGESWGDTTRQARKAGRRILKRECKAYCPTCAKKRKSRPSGPRP